MINYFGTSSNKIVIPEFGKDAVLKSIREANRQMEQKEVSEKNTALDFYYNRNMDKHLEQWFSGGNLSQVPPFPQKIVSRFARARMMLYKQAPLRLLDGEENEDYKSLAFKLNSKTREFAELSWLLGECSFRTKYNDRKERLEYDILPVTKKYYVNGESEPFGVSYEIDKDVKGDRRFVFWSETRNGEQGLHFIFDQAGKIIQVNEDMINPYDILPVSFVSYPSAAMDVVRAAVQIGIAMTEIALGVRFSLGQPVITGVHDQEGLFAGIDKAVLLPEGATFQYVSPTGSITAMIESVKAFANMVAENNHLRIRWGESGGNVPSGEALRILEIENIESRESDIPIWREWEQSRYEIDRTVLAVHTGKMLPENLSLDFGEVKFPLSPSEERAWLDWKMDKGIMTKKELLLYFNPDMSDDELKLKMGELDEEKKAEAPVETETPLLDILQA